MPARAGLAYVVVQHLDPTQKTLLVELLQRVTPMPVREAEQGMRIEPDAVFVIPPDTELRVADGNLKLSHPDEPRGMRLPINVLFSSLASVQGERAIAVLFSGMGSDGTPGLQAIKAVGGLTLVQDPDTAQFDAMPRSAIYAGCADIIAAPDELPARLMACNNQLPDPTTDTAAQETPAAPLQQTRHDFSLYKPSTLHRRVGRSMAIHGITSMQRYADFLSQNAAEIDLLFKELLIGVTAFFRDAGAWQTLANTALPAMLAARATEHSLRAWCIGCSTGEEPYSLAMIVHELTEHLPRADEFSLQIFASDLNPEAIAIARRGHFLPAIRDQVSPQRLARFFTPTESGDRIHENIRDKVLFAQHDVILDPPFTRLDLIICRNLLIYFDPLLQRKLLPLFHYCLRNAGVLMLGSSETIGRSGHLFAAIDSRQRLYRRHGRASPPGPEILLHALPPLSRQLKDNPVTPKKVPSPADAQPVDVTVQALREDARATREQLQSSNEELQSANEELTTSKEEMQSMN